MTTTTTTTTTTRRPRPVFDYAKSITSEGLILKE
jgi:hypothetical protein